MPLRWGSDEGQASTDFNITFSPTPFPGYHAKADWVSEESGGNWYRAEIDGEEALTGWLCPALLKYFPEAPKTIYVKVGP